MKITEGYFQNETVILRVITGQDTPSVKFIGNIEFALNKSREQVKTREELSHTLSYLYIKVRRIWIGARNKKCVKSGTDITTIEKNLKSEKITKIPNIEINYDKLVKFLGFIISPYSIKAEPGKLKINNLTFPYSSDKKQLQAMLGICGYFRRISVRHADFIYLFRAVLSDGAKWKWTENHNQAFDCIQNNFINTVT